MIMAKPLEGLVVLDLSRVLAAPFTGMILADMGANVIKVEARGKGDDSRAYPPFVKGESAYYMSLNRGKRSMTLNLKSPDGKQILKDLVKKADVLVENFRGGTMDKLGLGYDVLHEINPKLIYSACTGFGMTGPYKTDPAYDVIVQGMGGIMSITGQPGGEPTKCGASIGDITAGLFSAIGIMMALYAREKTGKGQLVDVSMLDCQVAILENAIARYTNAGVSPKPIGNRHASITPFQALPCSDGYVIVAVGNDNLWKKFCTVIERPDLAADERFTTNPLRTANVEALTVELNKTFKTKTMDEWLHLIKDAGIPVGPINDVARVIKDPAVVARDMIVTTHHPVAGDVIMAGVPIKLSETPGSVDGPAPVLGEHTREILKEQLGLSDAKLDELYANETL
jgi:CoA:oxalate CoA-transferase